MKVKLILPALIEAKSPYWRLIKYSLCPPLGLATLTDHHPDEIIEGYNWDWTYKNFYSWRNIVFSSSYHLASPGHAMKLSTLKRGQQPTNHIGESAGVMNHVR